MAWDFETEPEFEGSSPGCASSSRRRSSPRGARPSTKETHRAGHKPLKAEVKGAGLWAAHLEPELGGGGFGQVKLGLMHEILGRRARARRSSATTRPTPATPSCIALGGTEEQKKKWMEPLLAGEMLERVLDDRARRGLGSQADQDAAVPRRRRVGDQRPQVVTSNGSRADFLIAMAVTNPDVAPLPGVVDVHRPTDTPGSRSCATCR